ncbi:MAG TPA: enoyl-CoA hydratase-related protein, partial [Syntrophales bacterium]|nr:enoyl-CoA hydratase-related protein [Syntrophales bacterium]
NARFIDSHAKIGIHPGWGMTQLLQQAVGLRMAKQISFTGKPISAQDALRLRLVNEVVAPEALLPRAKEIACDICAVNQDIMSTMKELMEKRNGLTHDEAFQAETDSFHEFLKKVEMF